MGLIGTPVVVQCEEIVAEVPSYFMDPVRACPATTLYESAQVHGVLERVDDVDAKAAVLQALMGRFQPEGGHAPIARSEPRFDELYASAVRGILIAGVSLQNLDGKSKLAQNKTPAEVALLCEKLWQRGAPGDVRAVDRIVHANRARPDFVLPAFLRAPLGFAAHGHLDDDDGSCADAAASLLHDAYWNEGVSREEIARAHRSSSAWVGITDDRDGALVASARALADGAKWGTIYDVIVRPDVRARGLGRCVVQLILDHPAVRSCRKIHLRTRDAQGLYARFGFVERAPSLNTEMTRTLVL
jgi:GNAT superfamily N-acetyltransferase